MTLTYKIKKGTASPHGFFKREAPLPVSLSDNTPDGNFLLKKLKFKKVEQY